MNSRFIEWSGVIINLDGVKIINRSVDNSCIEKKINEDTGELEVVTTGEPYMITFKMADKTVLHTSYVTDAERDAAFLDLKSLIDGIMQGQFAEWNGLLINVDYIRLAKKFYDKEAKTRQYMITFDMGDDTVFHLSYMTENERNKNFELLYSVFKIGE